MSPDLEPATCKGRRGVVCTVCRVQPRPAELLETQLESEPVTDSSGHNFTVSSVWASVTITRVTE